MDQEQAPGRLRRLRTRVGRIRNWRETDTGQTLVEFSLILPLLLIMLFGLVDFGRAFYTWLVVTNAAREGARTGATQQDLSAIQTRINQSIGSLDPAELTMTITNVQGPRGQPITVDLTYDFQYVTPIGGIINIVTGGSLATPTISSHASMRLE